jgi:hypothetical protein
MKQGETVTKKTKNMKKPTKPVKVIVTEHDIKKGVPGDEDSCPIALALKRRFRRDDITVGDYTIIIDGYVMKHLAVTDRFVEAFDEGGFVRPFSFVINPRRLSLVDDEDDEL